MSGVNPPGNQALEGCPGIYWGLWDKAALDQLRGGRQPSRKGHPFTLGQATPPEPRTEESTCSVDEGLLAATERPGNMGARSRWAKATPRGPGSPVERLGAGNRRTRREASTEPGVAGSEGRG